VPTVGFSLLGATVSQLVWLILGRSNKRIGDDSTLLRDSPASVVELSKVVPVARPFVISRVKAVPSERPVEIHLWHARFSRISVEPSGIAEVTLACLPDYRRKHPSPLLDYSGATVLLPAEALDD